MARPAGLPRSRPAGWGERHGTRMVTSGLEWGQRVVASFGGSDVHLLRFIEHKGKRILYLNLANASPREHAAGLLAAASAVVAAPERSVLLLVDVSGAGQSDEADEAVLRFGEQVEGKLRAEALVGLSGLRRRAYDRARLLPPGEQAAFEDLEDAREWLAARA